MLFDLTAFDGIPVVVLWGHLLKLGVLLLASSWLARGIGSGAAGVTGKGALRRR